MYRLPKSAQRLEQLSTALRFALWIAQARDFASKMAQARRQIGQQDFVWRQIVLLQVALKVVASNQAAEQVA